MKHTPEQIAEALRLAEVRAARKAKATERAQKKYIAKPKTLILQNAKTDPNGNLYPFALLYRDEFGTYTSSTVERFATEDEAVSRGKELLKAGSVVDIFQDVAYTRRIMGDRKAHAEAEKALKREQRSEKTRMNKVKRGEAAKLLRVAMMTDAQRHQKAIDAETRGNRWLADGNAAAEAGNKRKADECYAKGQFWLDRYNLLAGNN